MSEWRKVIRALDELEWRRSPQTVSQLAPLVGRDERAIRRLLIAAERRGYVRRGVHDWGLTDRGRREARR